MIQITEAPSLPVQVRQQFSVRGVASTVYAGRNLTLIIDDRYRANGPMVAADGTWKVDFLFTQAGDRRLRVEVGGESDEVTIQVVTQLPPGTQVQITNYPPQVQVQQTVLVSGTATGYVNGTRLLLRADGQFELARPVVADGQWEANIGFYSPGSRVIEIVGSGSDRDQVTLNVVPVTNPTRLEFTNFPSQVKALESVVVQGIATGYAEGTQLLLRADGRFDLARPLVQNGQWEATIGFNDTGSRTLEILGTGSDRDTATILVVPTETPTSLRFTQVPQQLQVGQTAVLEGEATGYADGFQLLLRADSRFELSRPQVMDEQWQAAIGFTQAGTRVVEILGRGSDRAETTIAVVPAPTPTPRPPRLEFTNPPTRIEAEKEFVLRGIARDYDDGDQLVLRVDDIYIIARPQVQNQAWDATVLLRGLGRRKVEIIGSEQDRDSFFIDVTPPPSNFQIIARSVWTSNPTPSSLPNLSPRRITLHHTATSAKPPINASLARDAERMRLIWNSHVFGNGWSDIGYHFIIMPSGRVFAARSERKRGAHDVINDGLGIAFDGIYTSEFISQQQYQAAVDLCTELFRRYQLGDPTVPVPTPTADFGTRNLPKILGHRDRVATACPGSQDGRTVRMPEIRQDVKRRLFG